MTTHSFADRLINRALATDSRVIVGLDPSVEKFPDYLQNQLRQDPTEDRLETILFEFNRVVIKATESIAVGYKPQAAFYEQYGLAGIKALIRTITLLREKKLITLLDAKRNDIAHTAGAYATAWLAPKHPLFHTPNPWRVDAMTINGYLGSDGITPFLDANNNAGLFILTKTSNPSSSDLQDLPLSEGGTVADKMAALTQHWGQNSLGQHGYSNIGMVVGATYPEMASRLRTIAPNALFLMPGIGAQGGSLDAIVAASGNKGVGAYASSSRGLLYPFKPNEMNDINWPTLATQKIKQAAKQLQGAIQEKLDGHTQ